MGLHQTINSADRKCHLGHLLTSNGFISMTKCGLLITSRQGRAIKTAMEGDIIFAITNVVLQYGEFHSTFKRTISKEVTVFSVFHVSYSLIISQHVTHLLVFFAYFFISFISLIFVINQFPR